MPAVHHWPVLITDSYARELGSELCRPEQLNELPEVVLAHDLEHLFVYANTAAQRLWERPLTGTPSALTAPPEARAERARALAAGSVVRGYSGIRVAASGRRFRILDATVWPVTDEHGVVHGQAATFARWEDLGG